jgi:hypothetical protein
MQPSSRTSFALKTYGTYSYIAYLKYIKYIKGFLRRLAYLLAYQDHGFLALLLQQRLGFEVLRTVNRVDEITSSRPMQTRITSSIRKRLGMGKVERETGTWGSFRPLFKTGHQQLLQLLAGASVGQKSVTINMFLVPAVDQWMF